jgi:hypothetical protein
LSLNNTCADHLSNSGGEVNPHIDWGYCWIETETSPFGMNEQNWSSFAVSEKNGAFIIQRVRCRFTAT